MLASITLLLALTHAPAMDLVITTQPAQDLHMKVGQKLVFSVFGNASTGGQWTVKHSGAPELKYVGMTQLAQKQTNPPRVGQGATYLISFKAVKKGTSNVKLIYGRSWEIEKGAKPWGTMTAKVVIK